jgi:hypothetical protein
MSLVAHMMMPHFCEAERDELRRIEGILSRHPYLRVDLCAEGTVARALQDVVSVRLALLHTGGAARMANSGKTLTEKLRAWESRLVAALEDEHDATQVRMRYETAVLLHPDPNAGATTARSRTEVAEAWERWRGHQPFRTMVAQKLRQSRDFFRHGAMLPFYWVRRRRVRRLLPRVVLQHRALRETYFAIEQVGPLVDNFAFKGACGIPWSPAVGLADLAFFYIQLADEFLDELAASAGSFEVVGQMIRTAYRTDTSERPLSDLTLEDLWKSGVDPASHATKFGMSLAALFAVLEQLAESIDGLLRESPREVMEATHLFLHHCFQTYLDELDLCERALGHRADRLRLRSTAWHFYRKNNVVMMLWLDLRARLLGLDPGAHAGAIRRWGYLLAAFQVFDDLKDIALDLGKQPSYPLQIAANEFAEEFAWLERRFSRRRAPITREEVREVTLCASKTVKQCMQWSRLIALAHFDNTLLYAWDQRWRKSWTRRQSSFNPEGTVEAPRPPHAVDRFLRALLATRSVEVDSVVDEQLAYALDATAYDGCWQIYLALFPDIRAMYRFATLRMWMSSKEKARAARRLLRRYPRARASALLELSDGNVDHEIAGDRLEAFSKLIEV